MVRNAGYTAVRFGNVMGSRGSVVPFWEQQVKAGDKITITDKRMMRYFMSIPEACTLVIEAMKGNHGGKIVVLDMGELTNILDLKEKLHPGHPIKVIGMRPGETLSEKLMSQEEELVAKKKGKYWII